MPPTIIQDPMGFETGIKVTNIRSVLDREKATIVIKGRLTGGQVVGPDFEPEIQCDVVNKDEQICLTSVSTHQGVFSVTRKVSFTIELKNISQHIEIDDIKKIDLYVIFRRPCEVIDMKIHI